MSAPIVELIGGTPLIRLKAASEATGCEIFGKAEFLNPGGSVKDRTALGLIRAAETSGALKPGGVIVEGTAGNTGIGLALVAGALGYRALIVMPRGQSAGKREALVAAGAQIIEVDPAPYSSEHHFVHASRRIAESLPGAVWANQFDNPANKAFHASTTGREILDQTGGEIDGFICAAGTGGSLAGIASALRAAKPEVRIGLADPAGGALYSYFTEGQLRSEGGSITEGIGVGRITGQLEGLTVDHAYRIEDSEFLPLLFDLVQTEGLSLGGSAGVNIAGAIRLAKTLGPGKTIVTLLCDSGARYAGKLFNPEFLRARGLPVPPWTETDASAGLSA
ncbi:cysteine synthase A [Oceanicaulis sp. LC35]|uniref:cysteine synthase A n=1 Tax=Oceanicaulis sp. LC35 TaxID=3349635 RepID=UPI003F835E59